MNKCGLFLVFVCTSFNLYSQRDISKKVNTGVVPTNPEKLITIQSDVDLAAGKELLLPSVVDLTLENRFPPHIDQGNTQSCTSFVLAYALKTFQEAEDFDHDIYQDNMAIDSLIFSPSFLFRASKNGNGCKVGIQIPDAILKLEEFGSVSISDLPFTEELNNDCSTPHDDLIQKAYPFRIANFYRIRKDENDLENARLITRIKKRINNRTPIVIGAFMNEQFINSSYNTIYDNIPVWDEKKRKSESYHALLIVGYNDVIEGFKVYNSWGSHQYLWMKYSVFKKLVEDDIYAVIDIPARYQDSSLPLYANNKESSDSFAVTDNENRYEVAGGLRVHHFYEDQYYKISNLFKDPGALNNFIAVTDKQTNQTMKVMVDQMDDLEFKLGEKQFNFNFEEVENNISPMLNFTLEVANHNNLTYPNLPLKVENWQSGRIAGNSWRFRNISVELSTNGIFVVRGEQSNNRLAGWHGKLIFYLKDENGAVLHVIETPRYAQNGTWENGGKENVRDIRYSTLIDSDIILRSVKTIEIIGIRD